MSFNSEQAALNSLGNGLIGSFGSAGTTTGLNAGLGVDLGQDATNSMGSITADTKSCMPAEVFEESYQFTAKQTPSTNVGRMGSLGI